MGRNGTATRGQSIINSVNASIKDEDVLGLQVYWTLYSNKINTEEFKRSMEVNGISSLMLHHQTNKSKFLEVVKEVAICYGMEAKKISEVAKKVVVKFIKTTAHVDVENITESVFQYEQDTTVTFEPNGGSPIISGSGLEEIRDRVEVALLAYADKTSTEYIRMTFTDLLRKAGSISLRGSGGIYFIPVIKSNIIESVKNLTTEFNLGTIYQIRMPSGHSERISVRDAVREEVEQRLKSYTERIKTINRVSTFEDTIRRDKSKRKGIKTQIKEDIGLLMELYEEVLTESVNLDERQAEKDAIFGELREKHANLEIAITDKITDLEKHL